MEKDIEENALQEIKTHDDILMQWADKAAIYSRLYSNYAWCAQRKG